MENLIFTTNTVTPVFIIVFIGFLLKRKKIINQDFNRRASKIVFNVTLPALVFSKIATANYAQVFNPRQIIFVYVALVSIFLFAWIIAVFISKNGRDQGAFIQGSFRSNFAIIGFALIANAFGVDSLANAAILLAFVMPLYNVLAILGLTIPLHKEKNLSAKKTVIDIITNPLILGALVALPFSFFGIMLPEILSTTISYLGALTLPLALLAIGGSLSFQSVKQDFKLAFAASVIKTVVMPAGLTFSAILFGFRGLDLAVMFFLFAGPAAVASYIMADAMGSNSKLAGNIILLSTLESIFTLSLGLYILRSFSLI